MPRRAAVKGTRRPRKRSPPSVEASVDDGATKDVRPEEPTKVSDGGGGFFCCYLLRSLCPRLKGRTYIGFTVNPQRRIRQHNGEISSGAWRTRKGRPWEMVLCIHGFPTNVAALQFEWAWQHPKESLAVRKAAAEFKSLSGTSNKVKLVYTMLNLPSWEKLNLTVNLFSSASIKFAAGCPPLPSQMKTVICPMEDLQCHAKAIREACSRSSQEDDINDPQVHQGQPDCPHRGQQRDPSWSWKQRFSHIGEGSFPGDDFSSMEWDGIHDLTEPDSVLLTEPDGPPRTSSQCSLSSEGGGDGVVEDKLRQVWKQQSSDELLPVDAQTRPAVHDVQEDSFSDAEFASMESDGILDLTEPDGITDFTEQDRLRTSPQCSLSSDGGGDEIIEDNLHQVSPMWKVCDGSADGGDGRVVDDELGQKSTVWNWNGRVFEDEFGQALSPMWKACADSYDELRQASPMLKVGADSDSGDSGVTDDELGQACPMLMVDAGSEEGERAVVDLVTPTPVGRLWRRAGAVDRPRIIDLTASPVIIQL